jgi:hypothetical protein
LTPTTRKSAGAGSRRGFLRAVLSGAVMALTVAPTAALEKMSLAAASIRTVRKTG